MSILSECLNVGKLQRIHVKAQSESPVTFAEVLRGSIAASAVPVELLTPALSSRSFSPVGSPSHRFCGSEVQTALLGACVLDPRLLGQQVGLLRAALGPSREQAAKLPSILVERLSVPNT